MLLGPPGLGLQQCTQLSPACTASGVRDAAVQTLREIGAILRATILIARSLGGAAAAHKVEDCAKMFSSLAKASSVDTPTAHVLRAPRTTAAAPSPAPRPLDPIAHCVDCKVDLPVPSDFHRAALAAGDHQPRKRCSACKARQNTRV